MNEMFSQGGKGSTGILTNKQAIARKFGVKQNEVVYFSVGVDLGGYKVIYDKTTQRAYSLPANLGSGVTAVSLSPAGVLVHSAGNLDLGALAVAREEYVTLSGSFSTGVTINAKNELVVFADGKYRWDGVLPKEVPAGSTPETAGGVGPSAWVSVGDASLRGDLKANSGASIIGTGSGNSLQSVITKLSKGYLSESDGDLQALVNSVTDVFIDEDIDITTDIIIPSNTNIKTINGARVHFKGGQFKTPLSTDNQYWQDSDNAQIPITSSVAAGSVTLKLQSTNDISVGDKLIIKNGYCDLWRVLETSEKALLAVKEQPYKSEIVTVVGVSEGTVTITPTKYDYPLVPKTYGFLSDENALPRYEGLTRPSVTKILFKEISIDVDVIIHNTQARRIGLFCFVDGVDVQIRSVSNSDTGTSFNIRMSDNVCVHDVVGNNQKGEIVTVQETCQGTMNNLTANRWKGGTDTPFLVMLMSVMDISHVKVTASIRHQDSSAAYINTCDGGSMSNITAKNVGQVTNFSFSRRVLCSDLTGYNVDSLSGGYNSVACSIRNGVISGYCFLNEQSGMYKNTFLPTFYTIDNHYENVRRINDLGYGRVLLDNTVNLTLKNAQADKTILFIFIRGKDVEYAQGDNALISSIDGCCFGSISRQSAFYDGNNPSSINYPKLNIRNTRINGLVSLGGDLNPLDHYDIYTESNIQIGTPCFGVTLSGYAKALTLAAGADKYNCILRIGNLVLSEKVADDTFLSVDSILSTPEATIGNYYYNGAIVTDVYNRSEWVNIGTREAVKWRKI